MRTKWKKNFIHDQPNKFKISFKASIIIIISSDDEWESTYLNACYGNGYQYDTNTICWLYRECSWGPWTKHQNQPIDLGRLLVFIYINSHTNIQAGSHMLEHLYASNSRNSSRWLRLTHRQIGWTKKHWFTHKQFQQGFIHIRWGLFDCL